MICIHCGAKIVETGKSHVKWIHRVNNSVYFYCDDILSKKATPLPKSYGQL